MMLRRCVAIALVASLGSAALVTKDYAATKSKGCGKKSPVKQGETTVRHINVAGLDRLYRLRVPASYDPKTPMPVVISHHGW